MNFAPSVWCTVSNSNIHLNVRKLSIKITGPSNKFLKQKKVGRNNVMISTQLFYYLRSTNSLSS